MISSKEKVKEDLINSIGSMPPEQQAQLMAKMFNSGQVKIAPLHRKYDKIHRNEKCPCKKNRERDIKLKWKQCCGKEKQHQLKMNQLHRPKLQNETNNKKV